MSAQSADPFSYAANRIAHAQIVIPEPCCDDARAGRCGAYSAARRWSAVQLGLHAAVVALNALIEAHDRDDGANCLCANLQDSRAIRRLVVHAFERTEDLLEALDEQATEAATRTAEGGR